MPISGPSDFVHVIHMGPGNVVGLQNLIELRSPTNSTGGSPAGSQVGSIAGFTNNNGQVDFFYYKYLLFK